MNKWPAGHAADAARAAPNPRSSGGSDSWRCMVPPPALRDMGPEEATGTCEVSTLATLAFGGGPVGAGGGGGCAGCGGVVGPLVGWNGDGAAGPPAPKLAAVEGVIAGERVGTNAGGATWRAGTCAGP